MHPHPERPRCQNRNIDVGLAVAECHARCGDPMTYTRIAAFCGCSSWAIKLIERRALQRLRHRTKELAS